VNQTGSLVIEAERVGSDTVLSQIVEMVRRRNAAGRRFRVSPTKSPRGLSQPYRIAVITFFIWWFVGPEPRFAHAIVNAVAVLIIACPCALGSRRRCRSWSASAEAPRPASDQESRGDRVDGESADAGGG
jgi:Cation transport ATPase